jgi:hypothetical protein
MVFNRKRTEVVVTNVLRTSGKLGLALAVLVAMSLPAASALAVADNGSVQGKVVGKDGNAVSGAKVRLIKAEDVKRGGRGGKKNRDRDPAAAAVAEGQKRDRPTPVAEATSDGAGAFTMESVPAGEYFVVAGAKGAGRAREKVSVRASETANVDLQLKEGRGGPGGKGQGKKKRQQQ